MFDEYEVWDGDEFYCYCSEFDADYFEELGYDVIPADDCE
jgi:hypothetical protein